MKLTAFNEKDGTFSWRKAAAATALFVFAFSALGVQFGLKPLPSEYLLIISGVFAFYFGKKVIAGIGAKKKDEILESVEEIKKKTDEIKEKITVPTHPLG